MSCRGARKGAAWTIESTERAARTKEIALW